MQQALVYYCLFCSVGFFSCAVESSLLCPLLLLLLFIGGGGDGRRRREGDTYCEKEEGEEETG